MPSSTISREAERTHGRHAGSLAKGAKETKEVIATKEREDHRDRARGQDLGFGVPELVTGHMSLVTPTCSIR